MFSNLKEEGNSKRPGISEKINSDNSIINNPLEKKKKMTSKEISVALQGVIQERTNDEEETHFKGRL